MKFQTFTAECLATESAPKAEYQRQTTDAAESQFDMLRRLELSRPAHEQIMGHCRERDILFLSSPFDRESADLLDSLGVSAFKVPSGELTNIPFLEHLARKGKPLIVSTGMSTLAEVETALTAMRRFNEEIVLLHCVSNYPAAPADVNLLAMRTMAEAFGVPVGYSDHTLGIEVALAAVALGACVIEKHFTLDRTLPGPDHRASLEPAELAALVRGVRIVEAARGHGRKEPAPSEADVAAAIRKSLVAARDITPGTALTEPMIAIKRPGTGLPPAVLPQVVGRIAVRPIPANTVLTWDMLR